MFDYMIATYIDLINLHTAVIKTYCRAMAMGSLVASLGGV